MILTSLKLVNFGSPQLIDTKRLFSTFSTSASLVIGNIWSRRIAFRNQFFSKSQRPIDSKPTPKTFFDHNQYKIRCQTQNCSLQKMTLHLFVPKNSRRILAFFEKMSLARWFWAFFFFFKKKGKKKCFASQNGLKQTLPIGKMKLIKMLNLFQPIEFSLSKFDSLDPSYHTSSLL